MEGMGEMAAGVQARVLIVARDDALAGPLADGLDRLGWRTVTARGPNGQIQGTQEAMSSAALAGDLRAKGWVPLTIREEKTGGAASAGSQPVATPAFMAPKVTQIEVMLLSKQIHTLFKAGVPILRALEETSFDDGKAW